MQDSLKGDRSEQAVFQKLLHQPELLILIAGLGNEFPTFNFHKCTLAGFGHVPVQPFAPFGEIELMISEVGMHR